MRDDNSEKETRKYKGMGFSYKMFFKKGKVATPIYINMRQKIRIDF